ncbi:Csu type fimbrial protein [Sphingomonas profundi]|uniref:Csu type fimbrial protein n=1 Tax=Alterirhizorhabdus profundi TaxID=2681549 RepID=UPI0012E8E9BD|nr:spore coat U domain-containing protein [Sphingomonas profundi]
MRRILCLAVLLAGAPAAAETSQSFQVSARIASGCVIATAAGGQWGTIDFGTVSGVAQGNVEANLASSAAAGISIECTPGITASLSADTGGNAANGVRRLATTGTGGTPIPYQLLLDNGATVWTTQSVPLAFTPGATKRVLPIRGRALLARPMAAGAYADTVRVTLSW